jgi:hypothetical protein
LKLSRNRSRERLIAGWLKKATLYGTGYLAFPQEGVEGGQKIHVHLSEMQITHTTYSNNAL